MKPPSRLWRPRRGDRVKHRHTHERGVVLRVERSERCERVFVAIERHGGAEQSLSDDHVRPIAAGELELDGDDLAAAIDEALNVESLAELAHIARDVRCLDELAAKLEFEAIRTLRASDGFAERRRYDLAAAERERAATLRRRAEAVRALERARAR